MVVRAYKTSPECPVSSTEATPTPVDVHPTTTALCIVITSSVTLKVCIEPAIYARVCLDHSSCLFRMRTCIHHCCALRLTHMSSLLAPLILNSILQPTRPLSMPAAHKTMLEETRDTSPVPPVRPHQKQRSSVHRRRSEEGFFWRC